MWKASAGFCYTIIVKMTPKDRYDVSDLPEAQFEPGSRRQVLRNRLGIRTIAAMENAEELALKKATDILLHTYSKDHRFKANDIRHMHRLWLSDIYGWAGNYRRVNLSKTGFMFAVAQHVPGLMQEFETTALKECTPCHPGDIETIAEHLAKVHVELVLIHPFREGNGRVARLLTTFMALQADLPLLDYRSILGKSTPVYFAAIQAGMKRDYLPMRKVMKSVIARTLRRLS